MIMSIGLCVVVSVIVTILFSPHPPPPTTHATVWALARESSKVHAYGLFIEQKYILYLSLHVHFIDWTDKRIQKEDNYKQNQLNFVLTRK